MLAQKFIKGGCPFIQREGKKFDPTPIKNIQNLQTSVYQKGVWCTYVHRQKDLKWAYSRRQGSKRCTTDREKIPKGWTKDREKVPKCWQTERCYQNGEPQKEREGSKRFHHNQRDDFERVIHRQWEVRKSRPQEERRFQKGESERRFQKGEPQDIEKVPEGWTKDREKVPKGRTTDREKVTRGWTTGK